MTPTPAPDLLEVLTLRVSAEIRSELAFLGKLRDEVRSERMEIATTPKEFPRPE